MSGGIRQRAQMARASTALAREKVRQALQEAAEVRAVAELAAARASIRAVAELADELSDGDVRVRHAAATALLAYVPRPAPGAQLPIDTDGSTEPDPEEWAAYLRRLTAPSKTATPADPPASTPAASLTKREH